MDTAADVPDGVRWLWVVDGSAVPRPTALGALLAAAERLDQAGVEVSLLASRVVGPDGRLAPGHAPLSPQDETARAIVAASAGVLPVRAISAASLLARPAAISGPIPAGPSASMTWSARLLRSASGFLAPESVADARTRVPRARVAAALVLGDGLRGRERLRVGMDLVEGLGRRP